MSSEDVKVKCFYNIINITSLSPVVIYVFSASYQRDSNSSDVKSSEHH